MRNAELFNEERDVALQTERMDQMIEATGCKDNETVVIKSIDEVNEGDAVFISDFSCLGGRVKEFVDNFEQLANQGCIIHFVREQTSLINQDQIDDFLKHLRFAEMFGRKLRSAISCNNLAIAAKVGRYAGRPKGSKNRTSIMQEKAPEIEFWLQQGETKKFIAEQLGISIGTVYNYIRSKVEA